MAIRELIRRGYWRGYQEEKVEEGEDLGAVDESGADAAEGEDGATDGGATEDEGDRSLSEEIAKSIGLRDADEEEPDDKQTEPVAKDVEPEKTDPYAEPDWLKKSGKQTQDRFHELVRWNKEKDDQLQRLTSDARGFVEMVRETGANQEQFLEVLDTAQLIYHPEKANPQEAVRRLYNAAKMVAESAGIPLPGYDPLEAHKDLAEKVQSLDLDRETAEELARIRNRESVTKRAQEERDRVQQQQQQSAQVTKRAIDSLTKFLTDKQASDVDFPAKADGLMKAAQYARQNLPPNQWPSYMAQQYELIGSYAKTAPSGGHQPIRSGGGSKTQKTPGSLQEAIVQRLGL